MNGAKADFFNSVTALFPHRKLRSSESCIILFTKDRPQMLSQTVKGLLDVGMDVIVLDDSTSTETKAAVRKQCRADNLCYHSKDKQAIFLESLKGFIVNVDGFVKPLGNGGWNLGFSRNYALILCKACGYKRVLFVDDDIVVKNAESIETIIKRLERADFVGARVRGMPDDSMIGHLMRMCGGETCEFLSGGFLGFNLEAVTEYFLNHYNEDRIWLYLHAPSCKLATYGEVEQIRYNPLEDGAVKALRQEFGEILAEGAEKASKQNDLGLLVDEDFWTEILDMRLAYIKSLNKLCVGQKVEEVARDVCKVLTKYYSSVSPDTFVKVYVKYLEKRCKWRSIWDRLNGCA